MCISTIGRLCSEGFLKIIMLKLYIQLLRKQEKSGFDSRLINVIRKRKFEVRIDKLFMINTKKLDDRKNKI